MVSSIKNIVNQFTSITLKEISDIALMKRTDTKFVVHQKHLVPILEDIKNNYKVLEIKKNRITTYRSLYFDTEIKQFYHDHHNGKLNRTKIRIRKYVESNRCFLEIKEKDSKGKTNKTRIKIPDFETELSETSIDFIKKTIHNNYDLSPSIWNQFNRITLVNKTDKERVTIDMNLTVNINGSAKAFDNLAIVELKQEQFNRNSPIVNTLKKHGLHPFGFSKYCIGMISLYKDLKYNVFKPKLLKINKLTA